MTGSLILFTLMQQGAYGAMPDEFTYAFLVFIVFMIAGLFMMLKDK